MAISNTAGYSPRFGRIARYQKHVTVTIHCLLSKSNTTMNFTRKKKVLHVCNNTKGYKHLNKKTVKSVTQYCH